MASEQRGKPLSRAQEKAKSFIQEHNIEKIISEMLNSLVHSRDPKPLIFMVFKNLNFINII